MLKIYRSVGDGIVAGDLLIQILAVKNDKISFGLGNADDEIEFPPAASVIDSSRTVRVGQWLRIDSIPLEIRAPQIKGERVKLEAVLPMDVRFHRKEIFDRFQSIPWKYQTILCKAGEHFVWANTKFHIESLNSEAVRLNARPKDNEPEPEEKRFPRVDDDEIEALEKSVEEKFPNAFDLKVGDSGCFRYPIGRIKCLELTDCEAKLEFKIQPEHEVQTLEEYEKEEKAKRGKFFLHDFDNI
jgi:sRNA-binding carbon storage regulator CsrA